MLRDEIESKYTDSDGLILEREFVPPGPNTGNGIQNLCLYMVLLDLNNDLKKGDRDRFFDTITSCEYRRTAGLYNRGPRKPNDLIDQEDYVCLSAVSFIQGFPFARDIYEYGTNHLWRFENLDENQRNWRDFFAAMQWRHIDLVQFWKLCACEDPGWLGRMVLCRVFSSSQAPAGDLMSQWLMSLALSHRTGQLDRAVDEWRARLFKRYPDGMVGVFREVLGPNHPFTKYSPRV